MAKVSAIALTAAVVIGMACQASLAATTVNIIDYKGWKGCYELTNGITRIVVVPQAGGRIMEYSVNDKNIMWQNQQLLGQVGDPYVDWVNYGGYKLWNAPQDRWNWPPSPELDSLPAEVKPVGTTGLKIIGQTSDEYGLHFVKEVYLASDSSRAVISQRMYSNRDQYEDWSVWDVTQVITPGMAAIPISPSSKFKQGFRTWGTYPKSTIAKYVDEKDGIAVITHSPGRDMKFGADSPIGWAAYTAGNLLYIKRFPNPNPGEKYPDEGLNTEVFLSGSMGYVEVEILSPMTVLPKGGMVSFNEEWVLIELDKPVVDADDFRRVLAAHAGELRGYSK